MVKINGIDVSTCCNLILEDNDELAICGCWLREEGYDILCSNNPECPYKQAMRASENKNDL